jgi:O-antigen/teichoic acid export membrane protein
MTGSYFLALTIRIISIAVMLLSGAIIIRLYGKYLTPAELGSIAIPVQLLTYLPLVDLGFRVVVNRHLLIAADPSERLRLIRFGQQINLLLFVIAPLAAIFLFTSAGALHSALWGGSQAPLYAVMGLAAGFSIALTSQNGLLVGLGSQTLSFVVTTLGTILNVASLWACFGLGWGLWALPASLIIPAIFAFPIIFVCLASRLAIHDLVPLTTVGFKSQFDQYRKEAFSSLSSQISLILLFTSDVLLVSLLFAPKEAGIYLILSRIFSYARSFLQVPSEVSWPYFARHSQRAPEWALQLSHLNAWLQGVAYALMATALPGMIHWYLGPSWEASPALLLCLSVRFLLIGNTTPAAYYLLSKGAFPAMNRNYLREMLVGTLCGAILGYNYGIVAFAIGFMISPLAGSALPMLSTLSLDLGQTLGSVAGRIWLRAVLAFSASAGTFYLMTRFRPDFAFPYSVAPEIGAGLFVMLAFATVRFLNPRFHPSDIPSPSGGFWLPVLFRFIRWL